jgi:hypothetical protein
LDLCVDLVAPCGINCAVCMRYLATKKAKNKELKIPKCEGCRPSNKKCAFIKSQCDILKNGKANYCFECNQFPCRRIETLDRRYRTRYNVSLISNLTEIENMGVSNWLRKEEAKWKCTSCGGTISVHDKKCYDCELSENITRN